MGKYVVNGMGRRKVSQLVVSLRLRWAREMDEWAVRVGCLSLCLLSANFSVFPLLRHMCVASACPPAAPYPFE